MRIGSLALLLLLPWAAAQDGGAFMVHMQDFEFLPTRLAVPPGATVYAMNFGETVHTVTSTEGLFDVSDVRPEEPQTFLAPSVVGEHPFFCEYHPIMQATLLVETVADVEPTPSTGTPSREAPGAWAMLSVALVAVAALLRRPQAR